MVGVSERVSLARRGSSASQRARFCRSFQFQSVAHVFTTEFVRSLCRSYPPLYLSATAAHKRLLSACQPQFPPYPKTCRRCWPAGACNQAQ